ncbi:type II secretion system protein GspC [Myxococcus sp. Y35]|uniref:type II secretion system protein GspC n=1 Tax=Pseudomyxococcus flavus TaxID=3115648 RepID=UPI003CF6A3AB
MASFPRRSFWLVTTGFIALTALLVASTTNLFVEFSLSPPVPGVADVTSSPGKLDDAPRTPLEGERLARLTGLRLGKPSTTGGPDAPPTAAMNTSLRLKLLGTLVAHDSQWSLASVEDLDARRIRSVMTGDELLGARIVSIERERITFSIDGREEYLQFTRHGATPLAPVLANVAPLDSGIRAVGEHTYEVSRRSIDDALNNMDGLLSQARVVPAFRDGKPQGFKLYAVKKGSLYEQLGVQTGDVLRRINGIPLDSPERALEAFTLLRGTPHIELDIERGGAPIRKVYDMR